MSMANTHHEVAKTRYALLKDRAQAFCSAFLDLTNNPPRKIIDEHFTEVNLRITEHGPQWASKRLPFLAHTFSGRDGCLKYFALLSKTLEFIPNEHTFPGTDGIIVDDKATVTPGSHVGEGKGWDGRGVVSVVGQAKFKSVKTGRTWEEQFIYRLSDFDEHGRIGHWEIWADPLSAWVAVGGEKVA